MSTLAPEVLAAIEQAADEQYDANPGKPATAARASVIRPLLPPAQPEQQAA